MVSGEVRAQAQEPAAANRIAADRSHPVNHFFLFFSTLFPSCRSALRETPEEKAANAVPPMGSARSAALPSQALRLQTLQSEKSAHRSDFSLLWSCPHSGHKQVPEEDALCAASKDASLVVRASFSLFLYCNKLHSHSVVFSNSFCLTCALIFLILAFPESLCYRNYIPRINVPSGNI